MSDFDSEELLSARNDALLQKYALGGRVDHNDLNRIAHLISEEISESRKAALLSKYMDAKISRHDMDELRKMGALPDEDVKSASDVRFVRTYEELARQLGVTRKTIQRIQKDRGDYPSPRADGRHSVEAWLTFFIENGIAKTEPDGAMDDKPVTVADWKAREVQLKCQKLEIENAKILGRLVDSNDVEVGIASLMGAMRQAMNNLPGMLAQKMLHLKDFHEAEEIVQGAVDGVLRILERCDFLEDEPDLIESTNDEDDPNDDDPDEPPPSLTRKRGGTKRKK